MLLIQWYDEMKVMSTMWIRNVCWLISDKWYWKLFNNVVFCNNINVLDDILNIWWSDSNIIYYGCCWYEATMTLMILHYWKKCDQCVIL